MSMDRRDSWRESLPLRSAIDRLFEDAFVRFDRAMGPSSRGDLAIDVAESEQAFEVHATLPGVRPEDISVTVEQQMLTIEGQRQSETATEQQQWHVRERSHGRFSRTIRLPAPVDSEHVEAHLEHGVLTLRLPKSPAAQRRRIAVGGAGALSDAPGPSPATLLSGQPSGNGNTAAHGASSTAGERREAAATGATPSGATAGPGGQAAASGQSAASTQLISGKQPVEGDPVTDQSSDSFPASDPPSYTPEKI